MSKNARYLLPPEVAVWWADLTVAGTALEAALPAAERARLECLVGADRARRAVGAALLQHAVRDARGLPQGHEVAVDRTCEECGAQHGRPVVDDGPFVSVAHAGVLVVVATCAACPVGVDVERVSRFDGSADPEAMARRWVEAEARTKVGPAPDSDGSPLEVHRLTARLPGYAAALSLPATAGMPTITTHHYHRH